MFRSTRSSLVASALILLLTPSLAGCGVTQRIPFDRTAPLERTTGITTRSGYRIHFARSGASLSNDTVRAIGDAGPVVVPADSIAEVWHRKLSGGRTVGLVVGLGAVAAFIAGASAFNPTLFQTH
jgi:hypothetical protein